MIGADGGVISLIVPLKINSWNFTAHSVSGSHDLASAFPVNNDALKIFGLPEVLVSTKKPVFASIFLRIEPLSGNRKERVDSKKGIAI